MLTILGSVRMRLVGEWQWVLTNSWSLRFVFLAFVLSGLEVALPFFLDTFVTPFSHAVFASAIGLTSGAAFVARLVAQKRPSDPKHPDGE